ncbi:MAG: septum formation initiator family protein [Verrucomicrobia bacterium]|nr:MAG: septum formation initiator family protein [Verrucomicrobiota bacterium]
MIWALIQKIAWAVIAGLGVILVLWAFVPKIKEYHNLQKVEAQRSADMHAEQEIYDRLKQQQDRLRTDPHFVERIAREEIGLAKPGELVFKFVDDEPATNPAPRRR